MDWTTAFLNDYNKFGKLIKVWVFQSEPGSIPWRR